MVTYNLAVKRGLEYLTQKEQAEFFVDYVLTLESAFDGLFTSAGTTHQDLLDIANDIKDQVNAEDTSAKMNENHFNRVSVKFKRENEKYIGFFHKKEVQYLTSNEMKTAVSDFIDSGVTDTFKLHVETRDKQITYTEVPFGKYDGSVELDSCWLRVQRVAKF